MRSYHYSLPKLSRSTARVLVWALAIVSGVAVYAFLHLAEQLAR